ncbi:winged helix-turn-helix transcriptional regulator [Pseudonocardia cypriaca]|uniref:HxlR family transcriptional regulator n=1 Tax=Pseudonocardia cypriaca TaxID=882449 RepID=A0A543FXM4_9PSEU|nr:winged helix-turn-helix transcriptional regulator [Pseudonocardia cypriaca]TQM38514.1 HxlR family transcriptional regulator [Pseudonocardia cypriaca]
MTGHRSYGEACGIAHALDLVGERWALLIVRDLLLGPKRFSDIQAGLPAAGPTILAQRLRHLESVGVVQRRTLPPPAGSRVYELTTWGTELGPLLLRLGSWGASSPVVPMRGGIGADSTMLRLQSTFTPDHRQPWTARYEFHLGHDRFTAQVADGALVEIARGTAPDRPDAVVETTPTTLDELIGHQKELTEAVGAGEATVTGDLAATRRLLEALG